MVRFMERHFRDRVIRQLRMLAYPFVAPRPDNVGVSPEYRPAPPPYAGSQAVHRAHEQPLLLSSCISCYTPGRPFKSHHHAG